MNCRALFPFPVFTTILFVHRASLLLTKQVCEVFSHRYEVRVETRTLCCVKVNGRVLKSNLPLCPLAPIRPGRPFLPSAPLDPGGPSGPLTPFSPNGAVPVPGVPLSPGKPRSP